jgi:hypothetical protein
MPLLAVPFLAQIGSTEKPVVNLQLHEVLFSITSAPSEFSDVDCCSLPMIQVAKGLFRRPVTEEEASSSVPTSYREAAETTLESQVIYQSK